MGQTEKMRTNIGNLATRPALMALAVLALLATAAAGCGADRPASDPTATPGENTVTPASPTPTSTPRGPTPVPSQEHFQLALDAARRHWESNRPAIYTFDINWQQFVAFEVNPIRIVVEGDQVVRVTDPATGSPVTEERTGRHLSINGLFDLIQGTLDNDAGEVRAMKFDGDVGYPVTVSLDQIVSAVDDELAFTVSNFQAGDQSVDLERLREMLDSAMSSWFEHGPENYEFVFRWQCFCPPEANSPVRITVEGGEITSITDAESGEPVEPVGGLEYRVVRDLFSWISEQLDRNPDFADLEFDPETGYPSKAQFDPIRLAIDEEIAFFIEELKPLNVHTELQEKLNAAKSLWNRAALTDYSFRFNWVCFCVPDFVAPVTVTVSDGEVTSVVRVEDGEPVDEQFRNEFVTVDGLINRIQEAINEGAASIAAEFDPETGLPTSAFIDRSLMIADEEIGWNAGELMSLE